MGVVLPNTWDRLDDDETEAHMRNSLALEDTEDL